MLQQNSDKHGLFIRNFDKPPLQHILYNPDYSCTFNLRFSILRILNTPNSLYHPYLVSTRQLMIKTMSLHHRIVKKSSVR